jgi:hypothetical protein
MSYTPCAFPGCSRNATFVCERCESVTCEIHGKLLELLKQPVFNEWVCEMCLGLKDGQILKEYEDNLEERGYYGCSM